MKKLLPNQTGFGLVALLFAVVVLGGLVAVAIRTASAVADPYPTADWVVPKNRNVVVIIIHGGVWLGENKFPSSTMNAYAKMFSDGAQAATMNIDYHSGTRSLDDVVASYDKARQRYPNLPICAAGSSAGGNLALLLAERRPLACVVSQAGPTDLFTSAKGLTDYAQYILGTANYKRFSPALTTTSIKQPTLLISATNDQTVLHSQALEYKKNLPQARLITLQPGNTLFVHSKVNPNQLNSAQAQEVQLVKQASHSKRGTK